jgi:hypothetical protein
MKQGSDLGNAWQDDSDPPRRRWWRRLRWLAGLVALGVAAHATGAAADGTELTLILCAATVPVLLWQRWQARRVERRWRRDAILFEPPLPEPVSRIDDEREWRWPVHPLVRIPLALLLTGLLYWAGVLHQLQLPAEWLVAVAVVALLTLWCWREPLLLVLVVATGVALLSLLGWLSDLLSVAGAAGVVITLVIAGAIMIAEVRKRTDKQKTTS